MDVETEITTYLLKYGNTKESDILNYGRRKLNHSPKLIKKIIDRAVLKGKIHRIVHNRLDPPEVYISLKEPLPPHEILKTLMEVEVSEAVEKDAQKILDEAAAIAENRIRKGCERLPF